ncbi:hypothetical protein Dgeo_3011 (plasmid) [Deinococcus geothermalis DSM 11300]|uniref:Uncharacterized protein n=1 Tax=Deinococcus geothermalis (strain DSM 11300 / CIP 105573 / AG-3a) TaxID=319795 RepID=A8ZRE3_DEIGD|nr:hypothetical protein Dgeo_3011 [Deinococcus geothermalis DSM 11300]
MSLLADGVTVRMEAVSDLGAVQAAGRPASRHSIDGPRVPRARAGAGRGREPGDRPGRSGDVTSPTVPLEGRGPGARWGRSGLTRT